MCLIVYEDKICLFNEEVKNCVKSVLHSEMGFDNIEIFCLAFQILFNVPNKKLPIVTFLHAFVALERMSYGRQNLYKINNIIDCGKIRQVYFTNGFIMPVKTELRSIDPRVRLTYRAMASVTNECSYDRAVIRTYSFSRFIAVDAGENGSFLNGVLKSIKETDWRLGLWEFRSLYDDLNKRELMLKNATERKFNAFNRAMIKKWGSRWRDFFKEKK